MTNQTNWTEYTGSDEQIAELEKFQGKILRHEHFDSFIESDIEYSCCHSLRRIGLIAYWIIPDDPLREMKIRQAQTGQPVWIRECRNPGVKTRSFVYETTTPDWNIPNAEYSFTPWED